MAKKYYQSVGRRKTSTVRVRLVKGSGQIKINGEKIGEYFSEFIDAEKVLELPLLKADKKDKFDITAKAQGGGKRSQLKAVQLGISRALVVFDPEIKSTLKKEGLLTRDPRMKERKKPGLRRARRSPQWAKR